MVTHSSIAWRTPWTEEPGVPQSMGSQRVGYNLVIEQQQKGVKECLNFPRTYAGQAIRLLFTDPLKVLK